MMDANDKGQDTAPHLDIGNKPRAPPVAKKPKPLPPKKPSLPAKPSPKKTELQNGEDTNLSQSQDKAPPDQEPAPSALPPTTKTPPPLPKNSPQTSRRNRTPPPLPKNPPRGNKPRFPMGKSIEHPTDNVKVIDGENSIITADSNHSSASDNILADKTSAFVNVNNSNQDGDNSDTKNGSDVINAESPTLPKVSAGRSSPKVAPKVPLKPKPRPDKKIKDKQTDSSNERSELPSLISSNDKKESSAVQIGNSTWFVAGNNSEQQDLTGTSHQKNTDDGQNAVNQNSVLKNLESPSPKQSPKVPRKPLPKIPSKSSSPVMANDPKSKSETERNMSVKYTKDKGAVINNGKKQDGVSNTVETFHATETINDAKGVASSKEGTVSDNTVTKDSVPVSDSHTISGNADSKPQPLPKPVPRRSLPAGRPVPTPRKRLSINRLSGTEDTLGGNPDHLMSSSVHNLSMEGASQTGDKDYLNVRDGIIKAKSEENVYKASYEWDIVTGTIDISDKSSEVHNKADSGVHNVGNKDTDKSSNVINRSPGKTVSKTSDGGGTVVNSFVKSRVVFSEKGEEKQYRVIDKSVITSQSQTMESHNSASHSDQTTYKAVGKHEEDVSNSVNKDDSKKHNNEAESPENFDDLLSDKTILEPTSLLNEIEEILSRSHKHLSLTRSGSSPEKKMSPLLSVQNSNNRYERSRSVDSHPNGAPVRPPRPKKEQKRVRAQSQVIYDSCGSDTESLPDTSHTADDNLSMDERSMTLGRAKPHPPKPKRHKLLKVQRSQSDVTSMKDFVGRQGHRRQNSDGGPMTMTDKGKVTRQPKSWRISRPSRKAPPPPDVAPYKGPPTNVVAPMVNVVKGKQSRRKDGKKEGIKVTNVGGSVYHSIHGEECNSSSDGEHDYHEIPESLNNSSPRSPKGSASKIGQMTKPCDTEVRERSGSPPKLPPRNQNNSMSFETSSLSSLGHEFDSVITGDASSSVDDVSMTSASRTFPKTSSPNVVVKISPDFENGLALGASPVCSKQRPPSGVSLQSDSGSGSHVTEQVSSSESDGEDDKKKTSKKERKLFMIVQEIYSSEKVFVDVLNLLNVDFRRHISEATENHGRPVIPNETLNRILDYLPQLQNFNEDLLKDLESRISTWEELQGIADIFVKKGPFLKLYSSYIRDFETMTSTLDEALKKYPAFQTAVKEFEMSPRCASLALKHYMLKPIQRIPQYRLLLQDYTKHLVEDSVEMKDTQTALAIVSEVAHHANENMRHGDYVQKMLEIQRSLIGQFEVIKPGRTFLKEGELMKLSRKEMQPRFFFLFNDVLLYTTPVATGYRLNNVLPLAGMKVSVSANDDFKTEFSIISVQRSFTLHSTNLEERDDWVHALNSAIEENAQKRNTFEAVRAGAQVMLDKDFVLGCKAPLWIPDARVTMCMLCTCEFTVTWRRHHCRACGRVVCGNCSDCKAPLRYLKYKPARVCDECFKHLKQDAETQDKEQVDKGESQSKDTEESSSFLSIKNGLLERFQKIRRSGRSEKKNVARPTRLVEVNANDEGASMSGYLHRWKGKKWKRSWYLVKDKVLYTFKATQDTAAADSMVLLGYEVSRFTEYFEGVEQDLLFQLIHSNTDPIVFRTDSATATEKWVTIMRESSVT